MSVAKRKNTLPREFSSSAKTLLVVDDEANIIESIVRSLRHEGIEILAAESGPEGLRMIKTHPINVVLSDQNMPIMDGISFLSMVREYDEDIVRLLLTGHGCLDSAIKAINSSQIFEYLTKPWESDTLKSALQRAFNHHFLIKENRRLQRVAQQQNMQLLQMNNTLEKRVIHRTQQLADAVREGVLMLSIAAEAKDQATGDHVKRIRSLTEATCLKLGMAESDADRIGFFSMMHDVGKIHIPDHILNKKGSLSDEEWSVMKEHTTAGEKILGNSPYYAEARRIARSHHEWFDGSGYPDGLRSNQIPLSARIVAVADVYDAVTHQRSYKKAWPVDKAVNEIIGLAGRQFDPEIVHAFAEIVTDGLSKGME